MKKELPIFAMERLIKKAGANRVSEKAKQKLREILEIKAVEISKKAAMYAQHSGRKTVQEKDIKLALENL